MLESISKTERNPIGSSVHVGKVRDFITNPKVLKHFENYLDVDVLFDPKLSNMGQTFQASVGGKVSKPDYFLLHTDATVDTLLHELTHIKQAHLGRMRGIGIEGSAEKSATYWGTIEKGHPPDLAQAAKGAGKAGGAVPPAPPVNTFADFLDMQGLDPDAEDTINYFTHILDSDVSKYMSANDIRWAKKYRATGVGGLTTKHASQLMREIPGTLDDINAKAATQGVFVFHPKGELLKVWGNANAGQRSLIEGMARDYANGNITADIGSFAAKLGKQIDDIFTGTSHYQTFPKYFVDDWAKATAVRLGRHVQSRAVAETIQQVMDAKDELTGGVMWAIPVEDAPAGWARLVDSMPESVKKSLTPDFLTKLENTAFRPDIADTMTKGLKALYDVKESPQFLSKMRQGLSYIRAMTILPFAGYHVANLAGNRWGRYLDGVADVIWDAGSYRIRTAIAKGDRTALGKMMFQKGKERVSGTEVISHLFSDNVMAGGYLTAETTQYGRFRPTAMDIGDKANLLSLVNPLSRKQLGALIARNLEDHDRVAHYLGRLAKGDSWSEAAASVEKHLFRYTDLTDIEQGTKSMPGVKDFTLFYTWYRKNLGLTMQKMWEYPGRLSMPIKARNALNGAFGDPDSEYAVPSYLKDQFYFYLGKDKEGKPRFLDPEKYLPPVSAAKFFQGTREGTPFLSNIGGAAKEVLQMLIPPLRQGAEWAFGKELFGGRELEGVPGEKQFVFGQETAPAWAYLVRNVRILNAINKALFPPVERGEGRLRTGEPGKRTFMERASAGLGREWGGIKFQTSEMQRNRYFEAVSPGGRINANLDKISSKLAGDISPSQRDSYMKARSDLLWEKAEVIRQMIETGTDAFTSNPLEWEPPMPAPGERKPASMRDLYTEMHTTLRELYFGEPALPGIMKIEAKSKLKPDEVKQVFDTMHRIKLDMFEKDFQEAIRSRDTDILDYRVLSPIRDIIRTEAFYNPVRVRMRKDEPPGRDTHVYDYPLEYRQEMVNLFRQYFSKAVRGGLIKMESVKTRYKNFERDYGVDYR
mgnify:CR=1 FL=1